MPDTRRIYRGHAIYRCEWADDPHGGKWVVQTHHESGTPWADEYCPHYQTLREAREAITQGATWTCQSNYQGNCGVRHQAEQTALIHADGLNNLHNHRRDKAPRPGRYCMACDGGAYLDYRVQRGRE